MPEGDTLARTAAKLDSAVSGHTLLRLSGSHPALAPDGRRLIRHVVTGVRSVGKHLLIEFDHDWTLRTHLGMTGVWHLYRPAERWRKTPGKARVVLEFDEWVAVCFAAPTVQVGPRATIEDAVAHLGPDLIAAEEPAWSDICSRARRSDAATVADLLLDQRVMAGIGNVYKSEVMYLERTNPAVPPGDLSDDVIERLARRGRRLLLGNRSSLDRMTTGDRRNGQRTWVYGRAGQPCRRCGATIRSAEHGPLDRITYWCPSCQPMGGPQ